MIILFIINAMSLCPYTFGPLKNNQECHIHNSYTQFGFRNIQIKAEILHFIFII